MPKFRILYADCVKRLFLLLILGNLFLCGCAGKEEDMFLFEERTEEEESAAFAPVLARQNEDEGLLAETGQTPDEPDAGGETADATDKGCIVHICGAVQSPGVYELPEGSRVMDAVEAGGGFLPEADQDACNLAALVLDGCQIYIMTQEESAAGEREGLTAGIQGQEPLNGLDSQNAAENGKVNLNTADAERLKTLPGIGDSKAAAIIAFREEYGRFQRIEDVMKVSGIKQAAFEKMKDKITV